MFYHPVEVSFAKTQLPLKGKPETSKHDELQPLLFKDYVSLEKLVGDVRTDYTLSSSSVETGTFNTVGDVGISSDHDTQLKQPSNFVPVGEFEFKSEREQALCVTLENVPQSLIRSEILLETWLDYMIESLDIYKPDGVEMIHQGYKWTFVENEYVDLRDVFVEFKDVLTLRLFVKAVDGTEINGETLSVAIQPITRTLIDKIDEKVVLREIDIDLSNKTSQLVRMSVVQKNSASHIENLQELETKYTNYEIDPKELVDIPTDLVDSVKRDIIDFRLSVLKVEKQKREKQLLSDRRKAKQRVKRLFQDIQRSRKMDIDQEESEEVEDEDDDDEDDEQWEQKQQKHREQRVQRLYANRLAGVKQRDAARQKLIQQFESNIKHDVYETQVVPKKREQFVADFVAKVTDSHNKIDENLEGYYVKHLNYVNFRAKAKAQEERLDAEDRTAEIEEAASVVKETKDFISSFDTAATTSPDVLSPKIIGVLESKIALVIEEFLGMREDSLIQFIMKYVSNNWKDPRGDRYAAFLSELEETLDDDAAVAMDTILETLKSELAA